MPNSQLHVAINIDSSRAISSAQQVASAVTANLNTAQQVIDTVGNRQASALQGMQQKSFSFMTEALQKLGSTGAQTYRQYFGIFDDFSDKQKNALSQQSEINDSLDDHFKKLENQTNAQKRYSNQQQKNEQQWLEILTTDKKTDIDGQIRMTQEVITQLRNQAVSPSLSNAIRREIAAGVDPTSIRVTKDGRLINPQNPNGFAVINTRDEPDGRVPNFALPLPPGAPGGLGGAGTGLLGKLLNSISGVFGGFTKLLNPFNLIEKGAERLQKQFDEVVNTQDKYRFSMYRATGAINEHLDAVLALNNQNFMGVEFNSQVYKSLIDVGIQYQGNRAELIRLAKAQADFRIATDLSNEEISAMSKTLTGTGSTQKEVASYFEKTLAIVRAYGVSMKSLSEVMKEVQTNTFKISNTYGTGSIALEKYHDILLKVKAEFAAQEKFAPYVAQSLQGLIQKVVDFSTDSFHSLIAIGRGAKGTIDSIGKESMLGILEMGGGADEIYELFRDLTEEERSKMDAADLYVRQMQQKMRASISGVSTEQLSALAKVAQEQFKGNMAAAAEHLFKPATEEPKIAAETREKDLTAMRDEAMESVKTRLEAQINQALNVVTGGAAQFVKLGGAIQDIVGKFGDLLGELDFLIPDSVAQFFKGGFKPVDMGEEGAKAAAIERERKLNPPQPPPPSSTSKPGPTGEAGVKGVEGAPSISMEPIVLSMGMAINKMFTTPFMSPIESLSQQLQEQKMREPMSIADLYANKIHEQILASMQKSETPSNQADKKMNASEPVYFGRELADPLASLAVKKEEVRKASEVHSDDRAAEINRMNAIILAFTKYLEIKSQKPEEKNKTFDEMKDLLAAIAGNTAQKGSQILLRNHFYGRGGGVA